MGFLNSEIATEQLNLKKEKKKQICQRELMKPGKQGRVMYWFGYNRPVFLLYPTAWFVAVFRKIIIIHEVGEGCICSLSGNNTSGRERGSNCVT